MPAPTKLVGPRHIQMAKNWLNTAGFFGASATGVFLYFTDWKVVVKYIPYYGSRFDSSE